MEMTNLHLLKMFTDKKVGGLANLQVSISTIKCTQKEMGWVCTLPHYCQLLHPVSSVSQVAFVHSYYCLLDRHYKTYACYLNFMVMYYFMKSRYL